VVVALVVEQRLLADTVGGEGHDAADGGAGGAGGPPLLPGAPARGPPARAPPNAPGFTAGLGRVGRAVASRLASRRVAFVAVDLDPHRVARAAEAGLRVLYGDATRPEVLEAVHVERARAVVVALNNPRETLRLVALLRYVFPDLRIYARAYDREHAEELRRAGAFTVVPELEATGVTLAGSILDQIDPAGPVRDGPLSDTDRLMG